jgi:hypothetical protein
VIEDHQVLWKVQLWLDDRLIEEHIAPPELAEKPPARSRSPDRGPTGQGHCET